MWPCPAAKWGAAFGFSHLIGYAHRLFVLSQHKWCTHLLVDRTWGVGECKIPICRQATLLGTANWRNGFGRALLPLWRWFGVRLAAKWGAAFKFALLTEFVWYLHGTCIVTTILHDGGVSCEKLLRECYGRAKRVAALVCFPGVNRASFWRWRIASISTVFLLYMVSSSSFTVTALSKQ